MEGLLTEIVGSLIDRAADFTIGQVAQDTTWKEWKSRNKLSSEDNNFLDIYIEAIVFYAKLDKPEVLKNFLRKSSVIEAIKKNWYSEGNEKTFFDSIVFLAKHFTIEEQLEDRYDIKDEVDFFEELFANAVRESASVAQIQISNVISEANKKLDSLLQNEKRLPRGFAYLKKPQKEKKSNKKIKYQDYLESNNLPYVSRDVFLEQEPSLVDFISEAFIIEELLDDDSYEGGIIFGEGGVGKTRLMLEIGQLALDLGWVVIKVLPEAEFVEDLLPVLDAERNYLLLFDYIEENISFDSEVVSKLTRENDALNIRALANCRYTYRASSNFPDSFLQIELRDSEAESKYRDFVVREITNELIQEFDLINPDFFNIKPSFAVFLNFLLYKEKLETKDIREVGDFKAWIKKRFRLTFEISDFSKLQNEITYLISILPVKNEQIDLLYSSGYEEIIQRLKNNGWIEEVEYKNVRTLKVIHDTIADNLLLIRLEIVRKDIAREIERIFDFSVQFEAQFNWIRSFERIIEMPIVSDKKVFYRVLQKKLKDRQESLNPIRPKITITSLLEEDDRIELIHSDLVFFSEIIEGLFFAFPLSFALNKARLNDKNKELLREIFTVWNKVNPDFVKHFNISFRVLSTYIKCFGIDDFSTSTLRTYLQYFIDKKESSFVLQAWFDNGGDLNVAEPYVQQYLTHFATDLSAQFVLTSFLNNGGDLETVQPHVQTYLEHHAENEAASFVFQAWFDNGGDLEAVLPYAQKYLTHHAKDSNAQFVISSFLNNGGNVAVVDPHLKKYLASHVEDVDARFVMSSFLKSGGEISLVQDHVRTYLSRYSEDEDASFLFQDWFDNGGELEPVQDLFIKYLKANSKLENSAFHLAYWLKKGGEYKLVEDLILEYLKKHAKTSTAGILMLQLLREKLSFEKYKSAYLDFIENNFRSSYANTVLFNALKLCDDVQYFESAVTRYLDDRVMEVESQRIISSWLHGQGDNNLIKGYMIQHLTEHIILYNSQYLISGWLKNGGGLQVVQPFIPEYLDQNCEKPNTGYVFYSWFKAGGDPYLFLDYIRRWLRRKQPAAIANRVVGSLFEVGVIKNSYHELFDES